MAQPWFTPDLFRFLQDLADNNRRGWFEDNRDRYAQALKEPALAFIAAFGPRLHKVSPHFRADPRPVGGSLYRIHRDVRFSKDKSPYKTHLGIHFRHEQAKTAHAPGFYLHAEPGQAFLGVGMWRPERDALERVRETIAEDPAAWRRARNGRSFARRFELAGESLVRPPRGYDADHPAIEDLKRKDFIAVAALTPDDLTRPDLDRHLGTVCREASPFMRFLCEAVGVPF